MLGSPWPIATAQQTTNQDQEREPREWLNFKQARHFGRPILLHLRTGFTRAVVMPEPIRLNDPSKTLPGCAIAINADVIGFFPTRTFQRTGVSFTGLNTGIEYELRVRASPQGIEQTLQISR